MTAADSLCVDHTHFSEVTNDAAYSFSITAKTAEEIAMSLDKEFDLINLPNSSKEEKKLKVDSNTNNKTSFKSPTVEKVWTPLSHSTPVGNDIQPKDILKAKSKLSNLIESVHDVENAENDPIIRTDEHLVDGEEIDDERNTSFDDTPSKVKPKVDRSLSPSQKKELEKFKRLQEFIVKLPNGQSFLKSFEAKSNDVYNIETMEQVKVNEKLIDSLKQENTFLKKESEIITINNKSISEESEKLKNEIIELKQRNSELENLIEISKEKEKLQTKLENDLLEIKQELQKQKEVEQNLKQQIQSFESIKGDIESAITPDKYPSLVNKFKQLGLFEIESLSQIEAQNIIKNVLINLNIPFPQMKKKITELNDILHNEQILYKFANQIHVLLYEEKFRVLINDRTGLQNCTSQMYQNVELLYHILKK